MRYVQTVKQGERVWYYFRAGGVRQKLPGDPSSTEFQTRYRELLQTVEVMRAPVSAGSIEALMADYKRSPEFDRLSPKSRISYARELDRLSVIGRHRAADLKRVHILKMRDALADRPRTADLFVQVVRRLLSWAVDRGYLEVNPMLRIGLINSPQGHAPWTDAQCEAFEASQPPTGMMTAYMLGRYTGQRRGDVLRMTRASYDGTGIELVQGKTSAALYIPAHERLRAYLDALPVDVGRLVTTPRGTSWHEDSFTHAFGRAVKSAGLDGLTFHGLRHTAATALAEAGCSEREIQSITGHKTTAMVSRYTARADQKRRASAAIVKLQRVK